MLTKRELEVIAQFAECIHIRQERGEDYALACNWCNHDFDGGDLEYALPEILEHVFGVHPDKLKPSIRPVTDDEVAEVFGDLMSPKPPCGDRSPYISQYGRVECILSPGHPGEHEPEEHHRPEIYSWE